VIILVKFGPCRCKVDAEINRGDFKLKVRPEKLSDSAVNLKGFTLVDVVEVGLCVQIAQ
jgi:hypothetical protein